MTEDEARAWLAARDDVPRETLDALERFVAALVDENARQNLISAASVDHIWARHIVDSAQLVDHAADKGRWIDIGTGAGFPGLVVGLLRPEPTMLVEVRRKRAEFLTAMVDLLGLGERVTVAATKIESVPIMRDVAVISARACAPIDKLLGSAHHLATSATRWVLPKGRSAASELEAARGSWQGDFRIVASITDADAAIIVADDVRPRGRTR
jgi:16S rRNA (guanine527-N7)-methyltransferase